MYTTCLSWCSLGLEIELANVMLMKGWLTSFSPPLWTEAVVLCLTFPFEMLFNDLSLLVLSPLPFLSDFFLLEDGAFEATVFVCPLRDLADFVIACLRSTRRKKR